MDWSKIVKNTEPNKCDTINNKLTEKKKKSELDEQNIVENELIEYTPDDIFEFWYSTDLIDLLNDMESYTYDSSFNILNNRKSKICYDFIKILKNNIELPNLPEYLDWINKSEEINDEEIISDENLY